MQEKGFTLIELLVAIAIIAVLSTITTNWVGGARAKGRDAQVIREMQEVRNAMSLFLNDRESLPNENAVGGSPYSDNFNDMAQELVDAGFLSEVPVPPGGHSYHYYNYGANSTGGLIWSTLESYPESTGYSGTCRPFAPGSSNWCTTQSSNDYCTCVSY